MKYPASAILFTFAAVCALLGLEWFETHGGPVLIPPRAIVFAIMQVSVLAPVLNALARCRQRVKDAPNLGQM